jgi:hypothetical protein
MCLLIGFKSSKMPLPMGNNNPKQRGLFPLQTGYTDIQEGGMERGAVPANLLYT